MEETFPDPEEREDYMDEIEDIVVDEVIEDVINSDQVDDIIEETAKDLLDEDYDETEDPVE